jgi:hypothetical protein
VIAELLDGVHRRGVGQAADQLLDVRTHLVHRQAGGVLDVVGPALADGCEHAQDEDFGVAGALQPGDEPAEVLLVSRGVDLAHRVVGPGANGLVVDDGRGAFVRRTQPCGHRDVRGIPFGHAISFLGDTYAGEWTILILLVGVLSERSSKACILYNCLLIISILHKALAVSYTSATIGSCSRVLGRRKNDRNA